MGAHRGYKEEEVMMDHLPEGPLTTYCRTDGSTEEVIDG